MPQTSASRMSRPRGGSPKLQRGRSDLLSYLKNLSAYFWIGWTAPRPPKLNYPEPSDRER